jgi:hypothetical protein
MIQIAYFSTASAPQTPQLITLILNSSRANNARDEISGLLVAGGNRYLQVIEGPGPAMRKLWAAIRADSRHCAVTELVNRRTLHRCFEGWSMAFRREPRLGEFDTFPQTLQFLMQNVDDTYLRGQIELFARSFIMKPAVGRNASNA